MARKGIYTTTNKNNPNKINSFSVNLAPSRRRVVRAPRKRYASSGVIEDVMSILLSLSALIPVLLLLIWLFPKFFAMVGIALATWITYKIGYRIYSSWERS